MDRISFTVHLAPDLHARVKAQADQQQMPMASLVRQALQAHLKGPDKPDIDGLADKVRSLDSAIDRAYADVIRLGDRVRGIQTGTRHS